MLIRSQDKKSLVKIGNLVILPKIKNGLKNRGTERHIVGYEIWCNHVNFEDVLGTYSAKEKAIKVLDMIQEAFYRQWDVENKFVDVTKNDTPIFQMPQDEEVEV